MMARFSLRPVAAFFASVFVAAMPCWAEVENPRDVAATIDRLLAEKFIHDGTSSTLPVPISDEAFLRRACLDLVGQLPTPDEIIAFTLDPSPGKRTALIDQLLADSRFGVNWSRYWRDVIMYRKTEDRAPIGAAALEEFLATNLNENRPWSEVATAFMTAEGDVRQNGATGLIFAQGGMPEETVSEVSRIFLGIQIQCAQCHDHKTDRWKREQFHELAAFFPRVAVRPDNINGPIQDRTFVVHARDRFFPMGRGNNANRFVGTAEHFMKDLDNPTARGTLMQPVFFATGQKLDLGATDDERRASLAVWITAKDNPWFAKAFVNRIWAELNGEGFYEPVDDIGPDRTATAPRTLELLSGGFTDSGYDVKWLFRTITATDLYQRPAAPRRQPNQPAFAANVSQPMRGDQLYDALQAALGLTERPAPPGGMGYGRINSPRALFNTIFGFDPSEPRDEISASIPQALALMNSPLMSQAGSARPYTALGRLLANVSNDESAVTELYLRTLARQPSDAELKNAMTYIGEVGQRGEAYEDLLWSLINSTEFSRRR